MNKQVNNRYIRDYSQRSIFELKEILGRQEILFENTKASLLDTRQRIMAIRYLLAQERRAQEILLKGASLND